jgi:hypothetical protein
MGARPPRSPPAMTTLTLQDCEAAMKNVAIDDNELVRIFHSFSDPNDLVELAIVNNDERALRLLAEEGFLSELHAFRRHLLLGTAYEWASLRIIDLLVAAGVVNDGRGRVVGAALYSAQGRGRRCVGDADCCWSRCQRSKMSKANTALHCAL